MAVPRETDVYVVMGGTGFLGDAVVRALIARGLPVRVVSRAPEHALVPAGVELAAGDVLRPESLPRALRGAEVVINAVQFPGYPVEVPRRGLTFDRYDRGGTEAQVAAAREVGVRRFVYVSGVGADPASPKPWYRAKGVAEEAVRSLDAAWSIVRPSWNYGPRDNSINRFVSLARWLPLMPVVGDGRQRVQPAFIDDVGDVIAEAATGRFDRQVVEVGGPEVMTMDDVERTLIEVLGRRKPLLHVPPALPRLAGRVASLLPRPPINKAAVDFLVQDAVADLTVLLERYPDVRLRSLREGLATYLPR